MEFLLQEHDWSHAGLCLCSRQMADEVSIAVNRLKKKYSKTKPRRTLRAYLADRGHRCLLTWTGPSWCWYTRDVLEVTALTDDTTLADDAEMRLALVPLSAEEDYCPVGGLVDSWEVPVLVHAFLGGRFLEHGFRLRPGLRPRPHYTTWGPHVTSLVQLDEDPTSVLLDFSCAWQRGNSLRPIHVCGALRRVQQ